MRAPVRLRRGFFPIVGAPALLCCACACMPTLAHTTSGARSLTYARKVRDNLIAESSHPGPDRVCMPWAVDDKCSYVRHHRDICGGEAGIIDYLSIHYCWLGDWSVLSNICLLLWIVLLSVILTVVADRFFCPALEVLSDYFQLPANVAGATLLSFGNGAPDVFTQLAAVSTLDRSSVSIAIGEPLGGGMFVSNVVLAAVVWFSPRREVEVVRSAFLRDCGFYAGGVFILALVVADAKITLIEATGMLVYYGIFVMYIVMFERNKASAMHIEDSHQYQQAEARRRALEEAAHASVMYDSVIALATVPHHVREQALEHSEEAWPSFSRSVRVSDAAAAAAAQVMADEAEDHPAEARVSLEPSNGRGLQSRKRALTRRVSVDASALEQQPDTGRSGSSGATAEEPLIGSARSSTPLPDAATTAPAAPPLSWGDVLLSPVVALLHLTMPAVGLADTVSYSKMYAVLLPVTAPLFVVLAKGLALRSSSPLGVDALLYGITCSGFSSAVVAAIYPRDGRHYGILSGVFTAVTFSMAILWMDVAAGEMVRAWKCLGYIHGLSQAMLGVTVLAWANSFGDMVANVAMARDGFPTMAVAACFASPLFTTVAGLGMTFFIAVVIHGDLNYEVAVPLELAVMFALVSVVRYLILVPLVHKWQLGNVAAITMCAFYAVFQIIYLWSIATH